MPTWPWDKMQAKILLIGHLKLDHGVNEPPRDLDGARTLHYEHHLQAETPEPGTVG